MFRVLDIELLQTSSFDDVLTYFLPSAKTIRIFYGIQWMMLLLQPQVEGVKIIWRPVEHSGLTEAFEAAMNAASKEGAEDELIFLDTSILEGKNLFNLYKDPWHEHDAKDTRLEFKELEEID